MVKREAKEREEDTCEERGAVERIIEGEEGGGEKRKRNGGVKSRGALRLTNRKHAPGNRKRTRSRDEIGNCRMCVVYAAFP